MSLKVINEKGYTNIHNHVNTTFKINIFYNNVLQYLNVVIFFYMLTMASNVLTNLLLS